MQTLIVKIKYKWLGFWPTVKSIPLSFAWENWEPLTVANFYQLIAQNPNSGISSARGIVAIFLPKYADFLSDSYCLKIQTHFLPFWHNLPEKIPFTTFKQGGQEWALPLFGFDSITYVEFEEAMANLIAYMHTQSQDNLIGFLSVLVRPRNIQYQPDDPETAHQPQQPYNYALYEKNKRKIAEFPPNLFLFLLHYLIKNAEDFLNKRAFAPLFVQSELTEEQQQSTKNLPPPTVWRQLRDDATALPNFGDGDTIKKQNAAEVLRIIANHTKNNRT